MGATVIDDVTLLKRSSQPRSGTPDGNIYFDPVTREIEVIIDAELATVDFGAGAVPNPLTLDAKPTNRAIYDLHQAERETDETFRAFRPFLIGRFKLAKAFDYIYGASLGGDRSRVASSGWREFGGARGTNLNRIYFNVSSLPSILDTSQGYAQLARDGATFDFTRPGNFDEAIQVFGTTANGDAGAGDFDDRTFLAVSVRTYGQRHDRVILEDFGTTELEGYGILAALGESPHPTTGTYTEAQVYGGAAIAPWDDITFDVLGAPETKTGFNEADGDFSLIIRNPSAGGSASLDQVIAWIDAASADDSDIADTGTWNGKQREQLYSYNDQGIPVFIDGLFIEGLPTSDLQRLIISDDSGAQKTFPFIPEVRIPIPDIAQGTATGWYHAHVFDGSGAADYNTAAAVTMQDNAGAEVKGPIGALTQLSHGVGFDTFALAGITPGDDFQVIYTFGSDGEFEENSVILDITRTSLIPGSISLTPENNI